MANIFTANQVTQAYVVTKLVTNKPTKNSNKGATYIGKDVDNNIYVMQRGAVGIERSDLLDLKNVLWATHTSADKMKRFLKTATISLAEGVTLQTGEDYIITIEFQNPVGMSPDNKYWKFGVVHAIAGMTNAQFYAALAKSIETNMKREAVKLISVTSSASGVTITEEPQEWILGVKQVKPVLFTVSTDEVKGQNWGKVTYGQSTSAITNGKLAADYEYFWMGERADKYRNIGWPDVIHTEYLVDPTKEYDFINIHYYYIGDNHAMQRSEKDLVLLVEKSEATNVVSALETAGIVFPGNKEEGSSNDSGGGLG